MKQRRPSRKRTVAGARLGSFLLAVCVSLAAQASDLGPARTIDGSGNNPEKPSWGRAGAELLRLLPATYADGRSAPAGPNRPGAREISNACADQDSSRRNEARMSHFIWAWGQFVDHDVSLTGAAEPSEPFDIPVPTGDPFFDPSATGRESIPFERSHHGRGRVRQQINQITAWIDGSQIYGSDIRRARALRTRKGRGDRLKNGGNRMLPYNREGLENAPGSHDEGMFLAGDVRANENVALTALHVLFVREHNRIVRLLRRQGGMNREQRYQMARALVGAELQAVTYREFLPALLGPDALAPYAGYEPRTHPGIANAFSTACYRFGHSTLPKRLLRLGADGKVIEQGNLRLRDAFFSPETLLETGIEPLLRGLAGGRAQEVDTMVVDDIRSFLFGEPGAGGFDLAALNIQRGRDHGLPSYSRAREALGLEPAERFADVTNDPVAQRRLAEIYETVDDIDLWVGILAEDHVPGAMVGEVAFEVIRDQFERLRDGDRFWYQHALPKDLADWVEAHSLATIIRLNTEIGDELRDDPFSMN